MTETEEAEAKRLLTLIDDSRWRMSRGPETRAWRPPANELNPGSFKPQDQVLHALPAIDQTRRVSTTPGGIVDSNGQRQTRNLSPSDNGVTATTGPRFIASSFDGQFQHKNLKPLDGGVTASVGAPPACDVDVSSQNLHRAPHLPLPPIGVPVQVDAGAKKHGAGIPISINIR